MASDCRDNFSEDTKRRLAYRAGMRCSFCDVYTVGSSSEGASAVSNIGVAAHIAGAAPGSARYDKKMTPKQRSSIENGIWLCQNHGKEIDDDEATWTAAILIDRKAKAEVRAQARIGRKDDVPCATEQLEIVPIVFALRAARGIIVLAEIGNHGSKPATIKNVFLQLEGQEFPLNPSCPTFRISGREWDIGPRQVEHYEEAAWFFEAKEWIEASGPNEEITATLVFRTFPGDRVTFEAKIQVLARTIVEEEKEPKWSEPKSLLVSESRGAFSGLPEAIGTDLTPARWWSATQRGNAVGFAWTTPNAELSIAVSGTHRRSGIATELLEAVVATLRSEGVRTITGIVSPQNPDPRPVVEFLAANGFTWVGGIPGEPTSVSAILALLTAEAPATFVRDI